MSSEREGEARQGEDSIVPGKVGDVSEGQVQPIAQQRGEKTRAPQQTHTMQNSEEIGAQKTSNRKRSRKSDVDDLTGYILPGIHWKRKKMLQLLEDPNACPVLPLTSKLFKDEGYAFQVDRTVEGRDREKEQGRLRAPTNNLNTLEGSAEVLLPALELELPTVGLSISTPAAVSSSVNLSSLSVRQTSDQNRALDASKKSSQGAESRKQQGSGTQKPGARKDIEKGAYRSRLKYTLFAKKVVLQQALFQYSCVTSLKEKQEHFQSKRLVTQGKPSKEYVAGYNPKTCYGLVAVASFILREGCCTMTQAVDVYMKTVSWYAESIKLSAEKPKKVNIVSRLRLIITEQLPVIRISGDKLGLMYVDGVQHRQTYFLFPNLVDETIADLDIVPCLQRLINLKLRRLSSKPSKIKRAELNVGAKKQKKAGRVGESIHVLSVTEAAQPLSTISARRNEASDHLLQQRRIQQEKEDAGNERAIMEVSERSEGLIRVERLERFQFDSDIPGEADQAADVDRSSTALPNSTDRGEIVSGPELEAGSLGSSSDSESDLTIVDDLVDVAKNRVQSSIGGKQSEKTLTGNRFGSLSTEKMLRQQNRNTGTGQFSEEDLKLIKAIYGNETLGIIEFNNMQPSKTNLYMPKREECMLL